MNVQEQLGIVHSALDVGVRLFRLHGFGNCQIKASQHTCLHHGHGVETLHGYEVPKKVQNLDLLFQELQNLCFINAILSWRV